MRTLRVRCAELVRATRSRFVLVGALSLLVSALVFSVSSAAFASNDTTGSDTGKRIANKHFTDGDVSDALAKVGADPNLSGKRTIKTLEWGNSAKPAAKHDFAVLRWLRNLFGFIAQTGRVIVWLAIGVAVALLAILLARLIRNFSPRVRGTAFVAPTHVRDLDIRPETLPDDIGAAALDIWQRGERRAALSLLYRGLLSRLVHTYEVPIRQSSTERECVELARGRAPERSVAYATGLVRTWQTAVYGQQLPTTDAVQVLCADFAAALTRVAVADPAAAEQA